MIALVTFLIAFITQIIRLEVITSILSCFLLVLQSTTNVLYAQDTIKKPLIVKGASQSDIMAPFTYDGDLRTLPTAKRWESGNPKRIVPKRTMPDSKALTRKERQPRRKPAVKDPLLKIQETAPQGVISGDFSSPTLNIDGIAFTGAYPPDPIGDVGLDHYIQMTNDGFNGGSVFSIYNKAGHLLVGPISLQSLWVGGGACLLGHGDPVVLFDHISNRWLMSEFAMDNVDHLCVYISQNSDPVSGGWYLYDFEMTEFPDYPKFAVWPDAYYVSSNESSPAVYALDRTQMLNGLPATFQRFTAPSLEGFGFQALTPSDLDGVSTPPAGSPNYFVRHRDDEAHGEATNNNPLIDGSGSWQSVSLDLRSSMGSANVVIRFSFDTDDEISNGFGGFYVDDISISGDGQTVFREDFEDAILGWASTGLWHVETGCQSSQDGHSTPTSFYYGQAGTCDYNNETANAGMLTSPVIDLSGVTTGATLTFNYFLETEQVCDFDDARVEVSTDGGASFGAAIGNCVKGNPTQDSVEIWEFHVDFVDPENSTFSGPSIIPITEFDSEICGFSSISCFPQPGTATTLDPIREVFMWRAQYRNFGSHESIVGNFVTDVDGTDHGGIRWVELRKAGSGPWTLFQEGTFAPDNEHRWLGSIAMDKVGNVALGYSVSSESVFPSLRYAGRLMGDPLGTLPQGEVTILDGVFSQTGVSRWGDYSSMNVDPVDDCTFWYTNEYVAGSDPSGFGDSVWGTRIASFRFPSCKSVEHSADINGDNCVDRTDLNLILADIQGAGPHNPAFDLNGDGDVNIADARKLVTLFSNPRGTPCS